MATSSGDSTWIVDTEGCTLKAVQVQVRMKVQVQGQVQVQVQVQVLLPVVPLWRHPSPPPASYPPPSQLPQGTPPG